MLDGTKKARLDCHTWLTCASIPKQYQFLKEGVTAHLCDQGEDDALCVDDARLSQVVNAAAAEDLRAGPKPDGLWEVDALVLGQKLGG